MFINAKSYSGKYGTDENIGDIIHVQISVNNSNNPSKVFELSDNPPNTFELSDSQKNKEIIFLIDISGSMTDSLKSVKSSLLAFRNAILNKSHIEMELLTELERDELIRKINIRIITFSNDAKEVWSNSSSEMFEETILALNCEAMTNMGDAIKLAFLKVNEKRFTWIIAMTDGNSNKGPCKTANSFSRLINEKTNNVKIITLGYGNSFDPEVLNRVGSFSYIENSEMIPIVIGNLAEEFITSIGFNCTIEVPNVFPNLDLDDNTIISPDTSEIEKEKIIIGEKNVGALCCDKKYDYVFLTNSIEKHKSVSVNYIDIVSGDEITDWLPIIHTNTEPPEELIKLYFRDESKRLIYRLYRAIQKNNVVNEIRTINNIIKNWDGISEEYKEDVMKLIEIISNNKNNENMATTLNYAVGNGYSTPLSTACTNLTLTSAGYYMTSPAINEY